MCCETNLLFLCFAKLWQDNCFLEVKSKECASTGDWFFSFIILLGLSGVPAANRSIDFILYYQWHCYSLYLWPYQWFSFVPFYFSCMKSLKYPLLTAQLEQIEGIEEHPLRRFATEIIVSAIKINHSVCKTSGLVQNYLEFVLELILLPLLMRGMIYWGL